MNDTGLMGRMGRAPRVGAWLAAAVAVLAGCQSDGLYESGGTSGGDVPVVLLLQPATGGQVQAGQSLPIRVVATDPTGINQLTITAEGVAVLTVTHSYSPPRDSVAVDTVLVIPQGASGNVTLRVSARNAGGGVGQAGPLTLSVTSQDATAPTVAMTVSALPRMELTDSVTVAVTAQDNPGGSGLAQVGITAIMVNQDRGDSTVITRSQTIAPPASGSVTVPLTFPPSFVDSLSLPDTLNLEIFAWAQDAQGLCASAVDADTGKKLGCATLAFHGNNYTVATQVGSKATVIAVAGRTSMVPGGGTIADLVVDTLRQKVYASNLARNTLAVMRAATGAFDPSVVVGSQPWGLAMNLRGDTLYVANSGGTSISAVSLDGSPTEVLARRFFTKNEALYQIHQAEDAGLIHYSGTFIDFSDRPQFIAQDAAGRLLYSTKPTESARDGTVRVVNSQTSWAAPDARILIRFGDISYSSDTWAIAHVDSVRLFAVSGSDDVVEIYDHPPGFPGTLIRSGLLPIQDAINAIAGLGSDILWGNGTWNLDKVGLADTTYVAASGDHQWVAFGEGGTAGRAGRIILWSSPAAVISSEVPVADLVDNASERIHGVDLNRDGTLGVARGDLAAYFFTTDLRLQGNYDDGIFPGGTGASLRPDHPGSYGPGLPSSNQSLAFVGTGNNSIRIVDTVHFISRGEIAIRDNIVGVLRAAPPLPSDNNGQGRNCAGQQCIVVKLYGVTNGGGLVVVNVRNADIKALQ